jgi:hypothetical protein
MASAEKKTKTTVEHTITLTLTMAEAEAVAAVLGNVGGEIASTPRKESDGVFWALSKAGVDVTHMTGDHAGRRVSGEIRFHKSVTEAQRAKGASPFGDDFLKRVGL